MGYNAESDTEKWKEFHEKPFTLQQDTALIKEVFILDQLQSYMDLKDPANPKWVQPVRLRLQEKGDWKSTLRSDIETFLMPLCSPKNEKLITPEIIKARIEMLKEAQGL
jgi:hypothetical protein